MTSRLPCAAIALFLTFTVAPSARGEGVAKAEALLSGCTDPAISGAARLIEEMSDEGVKEVAVHLRMFGLSDGKHAVHVHETGACEPCSAAGGHFDPGPAGFSSPDGNHPFHLGDLVNIEARGGAAVLKTTTTRITLSPGPLSILDEDGSAMIVHVGPDTYCPDGAVSGCAGGARAACGVFEMSE
ncbi:MAG: superoxide dismutase family protein [Candidatus Binatia bacterium]